MWEEGTSRDMEGDMTEETSEEDASPT